MPSRVTRVAIKNYRSIASCDVELQPLTLLVGPNGSGKSNFIDALGFLAQSMHAPLEHIVAARYGIGSLLRKLPRGGMASSFSIQLSFEFEDARVGTYSLTVEGKGGVSVIDGECCQIGTDHFTSTHGKMQHTAATAPASTGDRPALVSFGALPQFAPVFNLIAAMTVYSPEPKRMRLPIAIGPGSLLAHDASNAADVFARLERVRPDLIRRIREYLRAFIPEFADVNVADTEPYHWLAFTPASNPSNWRINSSALSDGTLRAIGILLAVFQASTATPPVSLVELEEPESNLHPAAAGILLDALLEASASVPILASTHSADLLDRTRLPENAILAVALQDGETIIGPISDSEKSILRRRLSTAGELLRNNQLTPTPVSSSK